jgi:hypothetical protein
MPFRVKEIMRSKLLVRAHGEQGKVEGEQYYKRSKNESLGLVPSPAEERERTGIVTAGLVHY